HSPFTVQQIAHLFKLNTACNDGSRLAHLADRIRETWPDGHFADRTGVPAAKRKKRSRRWWRPQIGESPSIPRASTEAGKLPKALVSGQPGRQESRIEMTDFSHPSSNHHAKFTTNHYTAMFYNFLKNLLILRMFH
ncbi:MAG: hypothetical protein ACK50P_11980, partial [Planctomycetaceae bacterium]